jgi:4-amino-4-deoxy-L-arabinose transferase-like glycosyltransferase
LKAELSDNEVQAVQALAEDRRYKSTRLVCWIVCLAFALLEAWSQRQFINEDGISYLDMSDALLRHNWHLLINPIWSPLYPVLIGVATWLTRPSAYWEVPIVHVLNLIIFLGALASFEFLMREAICVLRSENGRKSPDSAPSLPVWIWQLLGYSLFAWSTFGMLWAPRMVTPDLCVAIFVYLDAGLLLSLRAGNNRSRICLLLGLTLGLGYLAKAILFPMAFVFMAVAFFVINDWRKAVVPLAVGFVVFCAVAAPLFVAMSRRVGRPSYSEAGNLNYAWHVNHVSGGKAAGGPFFAPASGPPPYLKHPLTLLHENPDAFGFTEPLAYTYPPRQDMEYWGAGTTVVFDPRNQIRAISENLTVLFADPHIVPMSGLIVAGLLLLLVTPNTAWRFKNVLRSWPLLIPGVVAICLYVLVSVEPRYIAPFLVLVLLGLFPGILLRGPKDAAKQIAISMVSIATVLMVLTALFVVYHLAGFPRGPHGESLGVYVRVGESLNRAGVLPGEEVALIGDSSDGCRWARMARVRIVAQILREDTDSWWASDPRVKAEVYDAFARAGAKAVVAEEIPHSGGFADWQRLGDTRYFVHFLVPDIVLDGPNEFPYATKSASPPPTNKLSARISTLN